MEERRIVLFWALLYHIVSYIDGISLAFYGDPRSTLVAASCQRFYFAFKAYRDFDDAIDHDSAMLYVFLHYDQDKWRIIYRAYLNDDLHIREEIGFHPAVDGQYKITEQNSTQDYREVTTIVTKNQLVKYDHRTYYMIHYRYRVNGADQHKNLTTDEFPITANLDDPKFTTDCPVDNDSWELGTYPVLDRCNELKLGIEKQSDFLSWHHGIMRPQVGVTCGEEIGEKVNCENPFKMEQHVCCPFCPLPTPICELEDKTSSDYKTSIGSDRRLGILLDEEGKYSEYDDYETDAATESRNELFKHCEAVCMNSNKCTAVIGCINSEYLHCYMAIEECNLACRTDIPDIKEVLRKVCREPRTTTAPKAAPGNNIDGQENPSDNGKTTAIGETGGADGNDAPDDDTTGDGAGDMSVTVIKILGCVVIGELLRLYAAI